METPPYILVMTQTDATDTLFEIEDPKDEYEQAVSLWFHTEAWKSQGSPDRLMITISKPSD